MNLRGIGLVLGFLGVTGGAMASFDLMLLPGADGRIYRYDPVSNVQLGSFMAGATNALVAANASGRSYSGSNSSTAMRIHDYSSGDSNGLFTILGSTRATELTSTGLWTLTTTQIRQYSTTSGNLTRTINLDGNVAWRTMAISGTSLVAVGLNASNQVVFQNVSLSTFQAGTVVTTTSTVSVGSNLGKAAIALNSFTGERMVVFTHRDMIGLRLAFSSLNTQGLVTSTTLSGSQIQATGAYQAIDVMPAAVAGHSGFFLYGQNFMNPDTTARVTRYDVLGSPILTGFNTFNAPGGGWSSELNGFHPANVVAPEPGTILALSAGAGMMLKRRRGRCGTRS